MESDNDMIMYCLQVHCKFEDILFFFVIDFVGAGGIDQWHGRVNLSALDR